MTDYKSYRKAAGITNPDMTRAVAGLFPDYSKVQSTMVNAPEKYGVCLLPEAERLLCDLWGPGPGLASVPFEAGDEDPDLRILKAPPPKKKKSDRRKKKNAVIFRMDDALYRRALLLKEQSGCASMQELFETLLLDCLERAAAGGKHLK